MKTHSLLNFVFCLILSMLSVGESFAAAGKFNFVLGDVRVVNASGERKVSRGSEIDAHETIVSGKDGIAQLRLLDGAFIAVRPNTELRIDKFQYTGKADDSSSAILSLVKGTFRAFTGAIASFNKDKFKMKTPTATIGIRGSGNVLNFSPNDHVTINYTIEGSHTITAVDPSGVMRTLVSMPGQTVQVNPTGLMKFIPTPAFILNAATNTPSTESKPQQEDKSQQQNSDKQDSDKQDSDKQGSDKQGSDKQGADKQGADKQGADKQSSDKQGADKQGEGSKDQANEPPGGNTSEAAPQDGAAGDQQNAGVDGSNGSNNKQDSSAAGGGAAKGTAADQPVSDGTQPAAAVAGGAPGTGDGAVGTAGGAGMAPGAAGMAPGTAGMTPGTAGMAPGTAGMAPGTAGQSAATSVGGSFALAAPNTANSIAMAGTAMPGNAGLNSGAPNMIPGTAGMNFNSPNMANAPAGMNFNGANMANVPAGINFNGANMANAPAGMNFNGANMPNVPAGMNFSVPNIPNGAAGVNLSVPILNITDAANVSNSVLGSLASAAGCTAANSFCGTGSVLNAAAAGGCTIANNFCGTIAVAAGTAVTCDAVCQAARVAAQTSTATLGTATGGCTALNNWCAIPVSGGVTATCDAACVAAQVAAGTAAADTGGCSAANNWCGTTAGAAGTTCATNPALCSTATVSGGCSAANNWCAATVCDTACVAARVASCSANPGSCVSTTCDAACVAAKIASCTANPASCTTGTTTASCVAPMVPDAFGACTQPAVSSCAAPMIWNGTFCVAQTGGNCTAPMIWDGTSCVAQTAGSCDAGTVWDAATSTCIASTGGNCAAGTVWDAAKSACVANCAPTAANNQCVTCATGTQPSGTGSCALIGTIPLAIPGFAATPAPGKMYDAFGVQVAIPASGYRHIGYARQSSGIASMDMALNGTSSITSAAGGGITSFAAPAINTASVSSINQYTVGIGKAFQMDYGFDPVSGMSWGRWQGNWEITNPAQGIIPVTNGSNLHWFALPTQTQAITLPITGTISYTYAGGTSPTDNMGTKGTLNSATLSANFTTQKVNVSVGVSMPASAGAAAVQLNAVANNLPILPGANFKTNTPVVTCTGCAGTATGNIGGQFSQGGMGAGVGYGLQNGIQSINGAAAFHR